MVIHLDIINKDLIRKKKREIELPRLVFEFNFKWLSFEVSIFSSKYEMLRNSFFFNCIDFCQFNILWVHSMKHYFCDLSIGASQFIINLVQ